MSLTEKQKQGSVGVQVNNDTEYSNGRVLIAVIFHNHFWVPGAFAASEVHHIHLRSCFQDIWLAEFLLIIKTKKHLQSKLWVISGAESKVFTTHTKHQRVTGWKS